MFEADEGTKMGETIAKLEKCLGVFHQPSYQSLIQVLCSFTGIGVVTVNDETAESYIKTANH